MHIQTPSYSCFHVQLVWPKELGLGDRRVAIYIPTTHPFTNNYNTEIENANIIFETDLAQARQLNLFHMVMKLDWVNPGKQI